LIAARWPHVSVEPVVVSTTGDRDQSTPIHAMGGKGVFVKEVQVAVLDGRADIAVHSAKDLPAVTTAGLGLVAVPERADPRDGLVGATLEALSPHAVIGTGSVRRRVQLLDQRPDLEVVELRGNIDTRLARLDELDGILMAVAALDRLRRTEHDVERLDVDSMVPQVGQGALAIEARADDEETTEIVAAIEHVPSRRRLDAERAFLAELGGDCDLPAGAYAEITDAGVDLRAMLTGDDHGIVHRARGTDPDGLALGLRLARLLQERLSP
jgi:hydroxymethylbilane synthase